MFVGKPRAFRPQIDDNVLINLNSQSKRVERDIFAVIRSLDVK